MINKLLDKLSVDSLFRLFQGWLPLLQGWRWALSLLGGGLLMALAPVNAWPLAWVALVPLWQVVHSPQQKGRRIATSALLWGVAYHGVALSWFTKLHPITWLGIPWLGSLMIMLFGWVFLTLWGTGIAVSWTGVMVVIGRWQLRQHRAFSGGARVLVGTAVWCAVEWLWSTSPLHWTSLSFTQSPYNLLGLQLGQLSGPITVTAAVVAVNGLLAEGLPAGQRTREESAREGWRYVAGALALFIGLHTLGLGLYSRALNDDPTERLAVGLVQGNIPTGEKLTAAGTRQSRQIYLEGYESLVAAGAELVITPEGAIPRTWNAFLQDRDLLQRAVVKNGVPLLLGTFAHDDIADSTSPLTQSLLLLMPDGTVFGRYNKVKLVPLGEYLPFEPIVGELVQRFSDYGGSMIPGAFTQQLKTPFGVIAAGICYDSAFAEAFRQQVARGAAAIFTASNNDPYPPMMMMQHHGQDVMRAIETNRWAVRVTNTGISGVVDPKGRAHWLSGPNEYATHVGQIYRRHTETPYVRFGDWLTPLLLTVSLVSLLRL
ncbi:MAG: apolipoprotein N-acyltransferase [Cyanobacteria bacterium J06597_16]